MTAYFVRKALPRSFASTFSDSPGSIYPVIERLKRWGLVDARSVQVGSRSSEVLSCTPTGEAALHAWLIEDRDQDALPEDPWRTRILFAEGLNVRERQQWLSRLRDSAEAQRRALLDRAAITSEEAERDAIENARLLTEARIIWLERMLARSIGTTKEQKLL